MTSPVTASTVAVRVKLTLSVAASKTVLPASSTYVIVRLTVSFKSVVVTPAGYVGTAGQVGPLGLSGSIGSPGVPGSAGYVGLDGSLGSTGSPGV
ncbi:hypothetical protein C6P21_07585 [Weissella confusa]|nr:hypothetical protein C6P21_07585 [Weissella confusa]